MLSRLLSIALLLLCITAAPAIAAPLRFDFRGVLYEDPRNPENDLLLRLSFVLPEPRVFSPTLGGFGTAPVPVRVNLFDVDYGTNANSGLELVIDPAFSNTLRVFLAGQGLDPFAYPFLVLEAASETPIFTGEPGQPAFVPGRYALDAFVLEEDIITDFVEADVQITVVPEPGVLVLAGVTLAAVVTCRRRRG